MKKLYYAAATYAGLGLVSGLVYRELTKHSDFEGKTQLSFMHTHLLALGMLFFLVLLALDKVFAFSGHKFFRYFFWTYNLGLVTTVSVMGWHGYLQLHGHTDVSPAIPGIAGLGHMLLTAGIICLFVALGSAVEKHDASASVSASEAPADR